MAALALGGAAEALQEKKCRHGSVEILELSQNSPRGAVQPRPRTTHGANCCEPATAMSTQQKPLIVVLVTDTSHARSCVPECTYGTSNGIVKSNGTGDERTSV